MTTVVPTPPPTPAQPSGRGRSPLLGAAGVVLLAIAALAAAAAVAVIVAFGWSGTLDSGRAPVSTRTAALVTDVASLDSVHGLGGITGGPTLRMSATGEAPAGVFVGIGPADDVAQYVAGVAVDRVTDLSVDPFRLTATRTPGEAGPLPAPEEQAFWIASASSASLAELSWPVQDGDYRLVVMNADGTPAVITEARLRLTVPDALPVALAVLAGSGLVAASGVALVAMAVRSGRRPLS